MFAVTHGWPTVVPPWAGGVVAMLIGAVAGLYPVIRATRLALTEALSGP